MLFLPPNISVLPAQRVPVPVDTSHALLHYPLDLLKHVGVFLVNPVGEISSVIQDL